MFGEDLEPRTKKEAPKPLDSLSIKELEGYIKEMKAEIERAEKEIARKEKVKSVADSIFK